MTTPEEGLVGAIELRLDLSERRGELGYWIGAPFWGRGFATEAARALLSYAFEQLGLQRVEASYLPENEASGKVLEKLGLRREGVRRRCVVKDGVLRDLVVCSILSPDASGGVS